MTSAGHRSTVESTLYEMGYRGGGVSPVRRRDGTIRGYRARIYVHGKEIPGGVWETEELAAAAVEALRERLALEAGIVRHETLRAYGARWMKRREERGRVRSARKERSHWRHVLTAPFIDLPMREITRGMVVRWTRTLLHETTAQRVIRRAEGVELVDTGRRLDRQTVQHALKVLRACLKEAVDEELLERDPTAGVRLPRVDDSTPKWTWLRLHEIDLVLSDELVAPKVVRLGVPRGERPPPRVDEEARILWTVAIYTGLRKGELAGLRWRDVVLTGAPHLAVTRSYRQPTKSGEAREVPLLPPALEALRRQRELAGDIVGADAPVWPSASGGVRSRDWDPGGWRRRSRRILERHVRFHDLRHTCASHLIQGSWGRALSLAEVGQWLGHSDPKTTMRYAHLAPEGLHGLAASMAAAWDDARATRAEEG